MPTTNLGLTYPTNSNPPDGPTYYGAVANAIDALWGAWTPWTPTVTQSGAVTFSTNDCAYIVRGKQVKLRGRLIVSGGSSSAGWLIVISGPPSLGAVVTAGGLPVGWFQLGDSSTITWFRGTLLFDAGSGANLVMSLSGGSAGVATFTAALAVGDTIDFGGKYVRA